ncbi:ACP S-malonyltransferase [Marinicella rhabdoformis]|uniref:ACP S-malonyltransferase n=1 Tax=Marinicella rhabdoformis TaxID=2580566 RepID=UPI0012AEC839|nr:acyltransferase domain-containing protein [Marinicella rhabdoformis]
MTYNAVVFPGQGAQKVGMAKDFIEQHEASAQLFAEANDILGFDVYEICHQDNELIHQTEYTQPCLLTAEVAMYKALSQTHDWQADYFAGHSLGEYSALVAAGVLPFDVALKMVVKRGQLMSQATQDGAMTAIIMDQIPYQAVVAEAAQFDVDVANDNSDQQVVLSGQKSAVDEATASLAETYNDVPFRAVPLTVSSAFHSRWMQPLEVEYKYFLETFSDQISVQHLPKVASNFLGGFYPENKATLIDGLAKQLSGSVKWRDNMQLLSDKQVIEIGPNRPLRGFFKTQGQGITSVINLKSAAKAFSA